MTENGTVHIFWDAQNMRWFDNPMTLLGPIYAELYKYVDPCATFRRTAVLPTTEDLKNIYINCGFLVSDPGKKIEAADRVIESIIAQVFEDSNPETTTIVLLSSDKDFSEIMRTAKRLGFYTIIVHNADTLTEYRTTHAAIIADYCHISIDMKRICKPCVCGGLYHTVNNSDRAASCQMSAKFCFHCNRRFNSTHDLIAHIPEDKRRYWSRFISTVYCNDCLHRKCVCRTAPETKLCPNCGLETNINDKHAHISSFYELEKDPVSICHQCYQYSHRGECKSRLIRHKCVICEMVCNNFEHLTRHMMRKHSQDRPIIDLLRNEGFYVEIPRFAPEVLRSQFILPKS